jgi:myo-inositol-1(or 4)-monophosphatase
MDINQVDLNWMLEVASVAARLAGQRAMEEINFTKSSVKNSAELVTQTDLRCQKIIIDRIKENYPDHGFIAEEGDSGKLFKQAPRGQPIWWVIDPIDGTNNYAHRILSFTVSVAAMYEGRSIVAAIFEPATESMFTAVKDGPALFNTTTIAAADETLTEYASVAVDSHFDNRFTPAVCDLIRKTRFRNFGTTALHLAYVGKAGLVGMMASNAKLWDIAAGSLIVERAGGIVTDWQDRTLFPVDTDSYNGAPFDILAANKTTHPQLLKLLATT